MENSSIINRIYFETFRDYADKHIKDSQTEDFNFNFGLSTKYDRSIENDNVKGKYAIQGTNPVKLSKRLEKELVNNRTETFSRYDYNSIEVRSSVQNALQWEAITWQLITEVISADYIFFEHKKVSPVDEDDRTPLTLLADIVKQDHQMLSCHYIIKWLEKIYTENIKMPEELNTINNSSAKFLYQSLRSGRVSRVKDRLGDLINAWKVSMLHGSMPSLGELIDPIGCDREDYNTKILEVPDYLENRN